jgi:hypothetical protein
VAGIAVTVVAGFLVLGLLLLGLIRRHRHT